MNIFVRFYFGASRMEREKRENKCSAKMSTFTVHCFSWVLGFFPSNFSNLKKKRMNIIKTSRPYIESDKGSSDFDIESSIPHTFLNLCILAYNNLKEAKKWCES